MKPYNEKANCPKCSNPFISSKWEDNSILRTCDRCGYWWYESCLDEIEKNIDKEV